MSDEEGYFQRYHRRREASLLPKPQEDATDVFIDMQIEMERQDAERPREPVEYTPFTETQFSWVMAALWPFGLLIAVSVAGVGIGMTDGNFANPGTWFGILIMLVGLAAMLYLLFQPLRLAYRLVLWLARRR